MLESFADRAADLLNDRNHGVVLAGVTLMLDICVGEPAAAEVFRPQVPALCRILRALIMSSFSPDYDVSGITDPFLQVKVLRLLRLLGRGSAEASDAMSDVLAQVATNTESARNAGNAILYECVQVRAAWRGVGCLRAAHAAAPLREAGRAPVAGCRPRALPGYPCCAHGGLAQGSADTCC